MAHSSESHGTYDLKDTPLPEWAIKRSMQVIMAMFGDNDHVAVIAHALAAEREAATEQCAHWLNAMPKSWELACENEDSSDLSSDLVWRVYTVHGGLNDREWTRLGTGDTPYNAISAAFIADAIRKGELAMNMDEFHDTIASGMESTPAKLEPMKAWGVIDYGGGLMPLAFWTENEATIEMMKRWPHRDGGKCRVIPVTITPDGE